MFTLGLRVWGWGGGGGLVESHFQNSQRIYNTSSLEYTLGDEPFKTLPVPPKRNPYTRRAGEKAIILKRCYNVTLRDIEGGPAKQPKLSTDVKIKKEESNEAYGHDQQIFTGEKVEEHVSCTKPKRDEKTLSDESSDQSPGA